MNGLRLIWAVAPTLLILASCVARKAPAPVRPASSWYSTGFPAGEISKDLEQLSGSVKKIFSVSSYITYQFQKEAKITGYHLATGSFRKHSWGIISTRETVFGTATILSEKNKHILLLTCAHVVTAPDTLVSWFEADGVENERYVKSISLKERQENWVKGLPGCVPFRLLAADHQEDMALLGQACEGLADTVLTMPCKPGNAGKLGWGCLVYIMGFPMGAPTVTSGLTTPAEVRPAGEFTVDALLNKGYSGGIVIAYRQDLQVPELVGMVRTVQSSREEYLKPSAIHSVYPDWMPYRGEMYIGKSDIMHYGINSVVPVETIIRFVQNHRQELLAGGYDPGPLLSEVSE
jgi:hypothetical protein